VPYQCLICLEKTSTKYKQQRGQVGYNRNISVVQWDFLQLDKLFFSNIKEFSQNLKEWNTTSAY